MEDEFWNPGGIINHSIVVLHKKGEKYPYPARFYWIVQDRKHKPGDPMRTIAKGYAKTKKGAYKAAKVAQKAFEGDK